MDKSSYIKNIIVRDKLDYFTATETWHCEADEPCIVAATPHGYTYEQEFRPNCYEGVVVFHKKSKRTVKLDLPQFNTLQCVGIKSCIKSKTYAVVCLYHAPHYGATAEFFRELTDLFEYLKRNFKYIVITGDLNVHLDTPKELSALHTFEVFVHTNMCQNVHTSTHRKGHILDIVVTNEHCTITGLCVHRPSLSDHGLITFACQLRTKPRKKKVCSGVCPSISHTPLLYVTDLTISKRYGPFDSAIILVCTVGNI